MGKMLFCGALFHRKYQSQIKTGGLLDEDECFGGKVTQASLTHDVSQGAYVLFFNICIQVGSLSLMKFASLLSLVFRIAAFLASSTIAG